MNYKKKYLKYKTKYLKLKKIYGGSLNEIDIEDINRQDTEGTEQYLNDLQEDYQKLKKDYKKSKQDYDYLKLAYGRLQNMYNDLLINYNNCINDVNQLNRKLSLYENRPEGMLLPGPG